MSKVLIVILIFLWIPLAQAKDCSYEQLVNLEGITNCAEQGDIAVQYMIGEIYFYGNEAPRNYKKAFGWHAKAAEQGHKDAQHSLFLAYYNGWGVPKNHVLAYMWLSLYIMNNNSAAPIMLSNLDDLEKELTPNELTQAQDMASDWLTKHNIN